MTEINTKKYTSSYLLVGNSRWHWAFQKLKGWDFFNTSRKNEILQALEIPLLAWAEVGNVPQNIDLDNSHKIKLQDIPLLKIPSWLGIDRALAGWAAFKKTKESSTLHSNGLLVADAGTVLSITKINAKGEFVGGQLAAGLQLQLKAMSKWSKNLTYPAEINFKKEPFPVKTEDAMIKGSLQSLIGTLKQAQSDAEAPLWLCGGDSSIIFNSLKSESQEVLLHPNLVLEGIIDIKNSSKPILDL